MSNLAELTVLVKGAGELASGVAHRLFQSHFCVCLIEIPQPRAVRRGVSFCEAIYEGEKEVEGVTAKLVSNPDEVFRAWQENKIPVLIDPEAKVKDTVRPNVLVDAIIAKKNLGTKITDAPLVIGLGVGFYAGRDVHAVIETNRGHSLGRVILEGESEPNTGIPGEIAGVSVERLIRAPKTGRFITSSRIGDHVPAGEVVAFVDETPVKALIGGVLRGLLRDGTPVHQGMKAGDVDPRGIREYCFKISDKSRTISGGVLEAILARFNR